MKSSIRSAALYEFSVFPPELCDMIIDFLPPALEDKYLVTCIADELCRIERPVPFAVDIRKLRIMPQGTMEFRGWHWNAPRSRLDPAPYVMPFEFVREFVDLDISESAYRPDAYALAVELYGLQKSFWWKYIWSIVSVVLSICVLSEVTSPIGIFCLIELSAATGLFLFNSVRWRGKRTFLSLRYVLSQAPDDCDSNVISLAISLLLVLLLTGINASIFGRYCRLITTIIACVFIPALRAEWYYTCYERYRALTVATQTLLDCCD